MKKDRLWFHLVIVGTIALAVYAAVFTWVEHRRTRLGPWEISFIHAPPESPRIMVRQKKLKIIGATVVLPGNGALSPTNVTLRFEPGREVPFEVPFGRCTYQDPLFLPGVVALELGGQQIQVFRRALEVNGVEYPWEPGLTLETTAVETGAESVTE